MSDPTPHTASVSTRPIKNTHSIKNIIYNGIYAQNPALVQWLGLCPLLALSNTVVNACSLGIATLCVLTLNSALVSLCQTKIPQQTRLPFFMILIAGSVSIVLLFLQALSPLLYERLGVFLALITTNCIILARIETFAAKQKLLYATLDGLMQGLGFTFVLLILGTVREILGNGTLFEEMDLLLGHSGWIKTIYFPNHERTFLIALLPPGAFLLFGFLLAIKNKYYK
jgi:electron transport complex protein RnfE